MQPQPQNMTMITKLAQLRKEGYTNDFKLEKEGMRCLDSNKIYTPESMFVDDHWRFEGMSNPSDSSIVYAVRCNDGTKGVIVSSYGAYAKPELLKFIEKMENS